jgi:hypothetical protein
LESNRDGAANAAAAAGDDGDAALVFVRLCHSQLG